MLGVSPVLSDDLSTSESDSSSHGDRSMTQSVYLNTLSDEDREFLAAKTELMRTNQNDGVSM